jgi:hypothetical protein
LDINSRSGHRIHIEATDGTTVTPAACGEIVGIHLEIELQRLLLPALGKREKGYMYYSIAVLDIERIDIRMLKDSIGSESQTLHLTKAKLGYGDQDQN